MARLDILHYPDPRLRKKAAPVEMFDDKLHQLVDDMLETMYEAPGIGLAATQVNIHKELVVVDVTQEKNQPYCFINAEIIHQEGKVVWQEGCLSVPEYHDDVERAEKIIVKAQDQYDKTFELEAEGLLAVCIQHELDHLQGKLFVDYLSPLKRQRITKKFKKLKKDNE